MASSLVTGGWAARGLPGRRPRPAPPSGVFAQFTSNLVHRPLHSSSRRGWRDRSVLSCRPRLPARAAVAVLPHAEFHDLFAKQRRSPSQRRSATSTFSRSTAQRASHALAVHEPQQRCLPGYREALGRAPADALQQQPGYGPAALVATHLPAEPTLQDHEGSRFSPGIEVTFPGQSLQI